jgi:multidrug efflux system membrane fusion protein
MTSVETKTAQTMQKKRTFLIVLLTIVLILLSATFAWYHHLSALHKAAANKQPLTQVVLADAHTADVPVYLSALGAIRAANSVTVRTQISGHLLRVFFTEGQTVKAGDLLAEIDSQPYQAQLMQFQGQLARDQALLMNAQNDSKRYQTLYPQGSVSKQAYDTQLSLVKQLEGTVKTDQGQIAGVEVNLSYCQIKSPLDGRVGLRLVDPGNFVQPADANGLAVVNTIQPITALFSIPEDNVPQVMQQIMSGKTLTVEAFDRTQNKLLATGKLLTIDNQIDPTTGTIKLKAAFDNQDNYLFPNQFVNIKLLVDTLHQATLIPTAAVQRGVKGTFVYIFNSENNTVNLKPVTLGAAFGDNSVIITGVSSGEKVVVEGADKLTDGMKVRV